MKKKQLLAVMLFVALIQTAVCRAQPMCYERWTIPDSGISAPFFDLTAKEVLYAYADPLAIGLPSPGRKPIRVIDIEYNLDSESGEQLISGIFVANEGEFKQESWFIPKMTHGEVMLMEQKLDDLMILDIERFEERGQVFFGAIVQRNRLKKDWKFRSDITMQSINAWRSEGYRVIDIDYVWMDLDASGGLDPRFDVVFAENSGENHVQEGVIFRTEGSMWNLTQLGYHVIDVEYIPQMDTYVCSYVEKTKFWDFMWNQSKNDINAMFDMGRVVDLEGSHTGPKQWYKIHLFGN